MATFRLVLLIAGILELAVPGARGFGRGAPDYVCHSMRPGHPGDPQTSPPPFDIYVTPGDTYQPNQELQVRIEGTLSIKGFMITTRKASSREEDVRIGTFIPAPGTKNVCGTSGLTHTSSAAVQSWDLKWQAPAVVEHDIVFRVTIVQEFAIYYVGVDSVVVRTQNETTTTTAATPAPTTTPSPTTPTTEVPTTQPPTTITTAMPTTTATTTVAETVADSTTPSPATTTAAPTDPPTTTAAPPSEALTAEATTTTAPPPPPPTTEPPAMTTESTSAVTSPVTTTTPPTEATTSPDVVTSPATTAAPPATTPAAVMMSSPMTTTPEVSSSTTTTTITTVSPTVTATSTRKQTLSRSGADTVTVPAESRVPGSASQLPSGGGTNDKNFAAGMSVTSGFLTIAMAFISVCWALVSVT